MSLRVLLTSCDRAMSPLFVAVSNDCAGHWAIRQGATVRPGFSGLLRQLGAGGELGIPARACARSAPEFGPAAGRQGCRRAMERSKVYAAQGPESQIGANIRSYAARGGRRLVGNGVI